MHVRNRPVQPVGEQRSSAGDLGLQVFLSQAEPLSEDRAKLGKRVVAAIGQGAREQAPSMTDSPVLASLLFTSYRGPAVGS